MKKHETDFETKQRYHADLAERRDLRRGEDLVESPRRLEDLGEKWGWLMTLGVFTSLAGLAALILPSVMAITFNVFLGVLLILEGVFQGIQGMQLRQNRGFMWKGLGAVLALVAGALLLMYPLTGVVTLAMVLGAYFIADGITKGFFAFHNQRYRGAGWMMFSSLVSVVLGGMVLLAWPQAAAWILGVFVGIHLLLGGLSLCALALTARQWRDEGARPLAP